MWLKSENVWQTFFILYDTDIFEKFLSKLSFVFVKCSIVIIQMVCFHWEYHKNNVIPCRCISSTGKLFYCLPLIEMQNLLTGGGDYLRKPSSHKPIQNTVWFYCLFITKRKRKLIWSKQHFLSKRKVNPCEHNLVNISFIDKSQDFWSKIKLYWKLIYMVKHPIKGWGGIYQRLSWPPKDIALQSV